MLSPILILKNDKMNWSREQIYAGYIQLITMADMVVVVNNNDTFHVLKNKWGKHCSEKGFEITLPMSRLSSIIDNPSVEGKRL